MRPSSVRLGIDASNIRAGGAVKHLREVLGRGGLASHGIGRVVVWGGRSTLEAMPDRPGIELRHDADLERPLPFRLAWQARRLPRLARGECDLVFCPGGSAPGGFRPYVTMSQNMLPFEWREMARYLPRWYFLRLVALRRAQSRAIRRADGVIFLTEYARQSITRVAGGLWGRFAVVPHGMDEMLRRAPRMQRPIEQYTDDSPFRLLYVSQIDAYKHQWNVVEAVGALRARGWAVSLELIGPAFETELWRTRRAVRRVDPEGRFVTIRGRTPFEKLINAYHSADGFVFASSCENLPTVLLEAMSAGLPIACSNLGPMPEVFGDAGPYFDPRDARDTERALVELLTDAGRRAEFAVRAHDRAAAYDWQRTADETLAFLASVAREAVV